MRIASSWTQALHILAESKSSGGTVSMSAVFSLPFNYST